LIIKIRDLLTLNTHIEFSDLFRAGRAQDHRFAVEVLSISRQEGQARPENALNAPTSLDRIWNSGGKR
jgi:hypothetical protein